MAQAKFQALPVKETNIITPIFRLSFPHVWEKKYNELAKRDQFDITMMFDKKNSTIDLKPMFDLMKKVAVHRFGNNCKGLMTPFKDGDTHKAQSGELIKEKNPMYEGHMILSSWSKNQPGVVNGKNQIILNHDEIYGGCFCRAQLNCYAYEMGSNRGVSFGLMNLQKIKDGDPFGGRQRPEDAFSPVEEEQSFAEDQKPAASLEAGDGMFS